MKTLEFKWLTDGDDTLNKKVSITDEEFESLRTCRGFPDEIDIQGGDGYPAAPAWLNRDDESHDDPYERPETTGKADAVVLIY